MISNLSYTLNLLYRNFHFIYAVFVPITIMVNSLWKTSPSSPPCEGGERGAVISSIFKMRFRLYSFRPSVFPMEAMMGDRGQVFTLDASLRK